MLDSTEKAVIRAIQTMRENFSEQLTVDDMARAAMFSKFHFSRVFQRTVGVSPGRFLSAIRLQEAKRLLISTSLNVADISLRVGYGSVGTFSTRFTKSVGMSPTSYRKQGGPAPQIRCEQTRSGHTGVVRGQVSAPPSSERSPIFVGLFPDRVPEGQPVRCCVIGESGPFRFASVPQGTWYLLCHSVAGRRPRSVLRERFTVATSGPITIRPHQVVSADVRLEPVSKLDPPVLLALLDTRRSALDRVAADTSA